jgi:hypothetical protein
VGAVHDARSEERERRLIENEQAFRAYNERRAAVEADTPEEIPFVCECGDRDCLRMVEVTADEWHAAHHRDDQFVVLPGARVSRPGTGRGPPGRVLGRAQVRAAGRRVRGVTVGPGANSSDGGRRNR